MKIEFYQTAFGENLAKLDLDVNQHIRDGWQPYGNPYAGGSILYQAMVCDAEAVEKLKTETQAEIKDFVSEPGVKLTRVANVSAAS
jgi:hypothetical protein